MFSVVIDSEFVPEGAPMPGGPALWRAKSVNSHLYIAHDSSRSSRKLFWQKILNGGN